MQDKAVTYNLQPQPDGNFPYLCPWPLFWQLHYDG